MIDAAFWFCIAGLIGLWILSQYTPHVHRPIFMPGSFVTGYMKAKAATEDFNNE